MFIGIKGSTTWVIISQNTTPLPITNVCAQPMSLTLKYNRVRQHNHTCEGVLLPSYLPSAGCAKSRVIELRHTIVLSVRPPYRSAIPFTLCTTHISYTYAFYLRRNISFLWTNA